jgi:hypothetical protein
MKEALMRAIERVGPRRVAALAIAGSAIVVGSLAVSASHSNRSSGLSRVDAVTTDTSPEASPDTDDSSPSPEPSESPEASPSPEPSASPEVDDEATETETETESGVSPTTTSTAKPGEGESEHKSGSVPPGGAPSSEDHGSGHD